MNLKFEPGSRCLKSTILTRVLDIGMTAAAFFPTLSFTRHISEINRTQAFTYTSGCFTPFYRVLALQVFSSSSQRGVGSLPHTFPCIRTLRVSDRESIVPCDDTTRETGRQPLQNLQRSCTRLGGRYGLLSMLRTSFFS